jgi:hypothetical protein
MGIVLCTLCDESHSRSGAGSEALQANVTLMRRSIFALLLLPFSLTAQDIGTRDVLVEEVTIPGMPGLQSFAWGQHDGQWFLIGGRVDGLHRRQPPFAFLASGNNTDAYVVDPLTAQVWSASTNALPTGLREQLQSTNMEFEQRGNTLYCVGGYGYSPTFADHITYPNLTAIDLPGVIDAIKNSQPIAPYLRQLNDTRMEVTGGQLRLANDRFHLVGGQRFIGRYNPMGPLFGPGFIQEYTNAIRRFAIDDDGVNLAITDYWTAVDTVNLHRRDYNMLPQVMPDGSEGLTVFSGVFQYGQDLPWLNTVDIVDTSYTVVPAFEQLLSQYHTAHAGLYDSTANIMHSLFFGGISRYYFNGGTLMDDPNVPFVNTISLVSRDGNGGLVEAAVAEMPALLGASGEFITLPDVAHDDRDIIRLDQLSGDTVPIGHIIGGIESSAANIFFTNTGTQSAATTRVFRVSLVEGGQTGVNDLSVGSEEPVVVVEGDVLRITLRVPRPGYVLVNLLDSTGRTVKTLSSGRMGAGEQVLTTNIIGLARGTYLLHVESGDGPSTLRFAR